MPIPPSYVGRLARRKHRRERGVDTKAPVYTEEGLSNEGIEPPVRLLIEDLAWA